MARHDDTPKRLFKLRSSLGCLNDQHSLVSLRTFAGYLYSDRVGLREGGGRGEPLPNVCAHGSSVLSGSIAPTLVMLPLHCLPASQAPPVLSVT